MQFVIQNSTVIPGPPIDNRNWLQKLRDWLMNRENLTLHREKFAYFYVNTIKGLFLHQMIRFDVTDAVWVITNIDHEGFNASLTSAIPLCELEKFNKLKEAFGIVIGNVFKERNV